MTEYIHVLNIAQLPDGIFSSTTAVYHTWEIFGREKLANLVNRELFTKIFLANTHRLAYALTVAYLPHK